MVDNRFRDLATVLDRLGDGVIAAAEDGTVLDMGCVAQDLTGWSVDDAVGRHIGDVCHIIREGEGDDESLFTTVEQRWTNWRGTGDIVLIAADGERRMVDVHVCPGVDGGSSGIDTLVVLRDVADQRRIMRQLHDAMHTESIGRLTAGIAHDYNNLLGAILTYVQLILGKLGPEDPLREDVQAICEAAESAATLTRRLLATGRRSEHRPKHTDLNRVIKKTSRILERVIGEDVELVLDLENEIWSVWTDLGQIEQVVMNLSINAREAMLKGGTLTIRTRNVEISRDEAQKVWGVSPGQHVMLEFHDNGTGIDEETRKRVFEPFFTTKEEGRGSGLGLSIVRAIIEQNRGGIDLQTSPGEFTAVRIYLPRSHPVIPSVSEEDLPSVPSMENVETLLVVEDDAMLRRLVCRVLREEGYTVLQAADAEEALAIEEMTDGGIDLALSDLVMPGRNGQQLARELVKRRPDIKIVYMSGYSGEALDSRGLREDDPPVLAKPFMPQELLVLLRSVLDSPYSDEIRASLLDTSDP